MLKSKFLQEHNGAAISSIDNVLKKMDQKHITKTWQNTATFSKFDFPNRADFLET